MVPLFMRAPSVGALVFLTAALSSRELLAQTCDSATTSSCINSETYWPNAGPMRFATVSGTETVARGQVSFGLVTSYQSRPIILRIASPGGTGSDTFVIDDQVNGNFLFAYGITSRLELDFALPVTFVQRGAGLSGITGGEPLRDTSTRDLRGGIAYSILPRQRVSAEKQPSPWSLAARFAFTAPTGDRDAFAGERNAVLVPSLALSYAQGRFFGGLDLGFRVRPVTELAGARIGTQLSASAGVGVDILEKERLALLLEGRTLINFPEQATPQQSALGESRTLNGNRITPSEWFFGARSAPVLAGDVSFILGGGGPFPFTDDAITVPRFRFVFAAIYAPLARDTDGDGVVDKLDACPNDPGPKSGEKPGCPPPPPSPVIAPQETPQ